MKLWRRLSPDQNGAYEEITGIDQISNNKPVIFVFPGIEIRHQHDGTYSQAVAEEMQCLFQRTEARLGGNEAEIIVATYEDNHLSRQALASNLFPTRMNAKAQQFSADFLIPLQERAGMEGKITLLGGSNGAIFAEDIRKSYLQELNEQALGKEEILRRAEDIVLITMADVSRAMNPNAWRAKAEAGFSGVSMAFKKDRLRKAANFPTPVPEPRHSYTDNPITGIDLPGNRIGVFCEAPDEKELWDVTQGTKKTPRIINGINTHHSVTLMHEDGNPRGITPILSALLRHAVRRTGRFDPEHAIATYAEPCSKTVKLQEKKRGDPELTQDIGRDILAGLEASRAEHSRWSDRIQATGAFRQR